MGYDCDRSRSTLGKTVGSIQLRGLLPDNARTTREYLSGTGTSLATAGLVEQLLSSFPQFFAPALDIALGIALDTAPASVDRVKSHYTHHRRTKRQGQIMQTWQVGDVKVTRVEELFGPLFDPVRFFPEYNAETIEKHRSWLFPDHMDEVSGNIIASMHSWLIETSHHKILVDTCIGNDKDRLPYRDWHRMNTAWESNLVRTGVTPSDIDFVMCTHLHVDHVGWNTRLQNGQWIPTFPNAKYVFSQVEFDFWQQARNKADPEAFSAVNNQTFDDSVLPILHLAELISGEHELIDDLIRISPAPGHTPGSMTLKLASGPDKAIFTGDIFHHPIQVYEPHWNSAYCELPELAIETRKNVLAYCESENVLMMPAHFGEPFAGHVRASASGFKFDWT